MWLKAIRQTIGEKCREQGIDPSIIFGPSVKHIVHNGKQYEIKGVWLGQNYEAAIFLNEKELDRERMALTDGSDLQAFGGGNPVDALIAELGVRLKNGHYDSK
jgi:hypothetical protein